MCNNKINAFRLKCSFTITIVRLKQRHGGKGGMVGPGADTVERERVRASSLDRVVEVGKGSSCARRNLGQSLV